MGELTDTTCNARTGLHVTSAWSERALTNAAFVACGCTRVQGFTSLLSMFEDGTFVCWLVSNLAGSPIRGAHRRPLTEAARRTNWLRALEALRSMPRMSRR